jgi:hypothetical protein
MSQVIRINNASLLLFALPDGLVVESYELARILGYAQQSSIRKQILTDWEDLLRKDGDYRLVHDHDWLQKYEEEYGKRIAPIKPVKESRGRLFLTPNGVMKVLLRTTKDSSALESSLKKAGFLDAGTAEVQEVPKKSGLETDTSGSGIDDLLTIKKGLADDRQFKYEVLQKLLTQLQELQDPLLRLLAIEAAEIALGKELVDLRNREAFKMPSTPAPSAPKLSVIPPALGVPDGPIFKEQGYYGLKQIGEMAGGYAPSVAGKAANVVAESMDYTAEQIRTEQLDFNELPMLPDSTTGKPRKMYRFNLMFANMVIRELRENPAFRPRDRPMPLTSFSSGSHPKLSQGPFDEDAAH